MRHKDCIFAAEEDCPKEKIEITCAECEKHRHWETIENAVRDFTGLGEAFTEIFTLHKQLIDGDGKTVKIETPVDSIFTINRVMTSVLSKDEQKTINDKIYQRLIFYFFKIIIDEFEEDAYKEDPFLH